MKQYIENEKDFKTQFMDLINDMQKTVQLHNMKYIDVTY